jgi:hypothetical protein
MVVRKILPDMDAERMHLYPHVASFRRKLASAMPRTDGTAIGQASKYGVIAMTFTA